MARLVEENRIRTFSSNPIVQQFYETHGRHVYSGNLLIFEDGAMLENSASGLGAMKEPSPDPYTLAKVVCRYHEIKAQQAVRAFERYKGAIDGTGGGGVYESTPDAQLAKLKELKAIATRANMELRTAKQEVEDATPAWMTAKKREDANRQREASEFKDRVRAVKL